MLFLAQYAGIRCSGSALPGEEVRLPLSPTSYTLTNPVGCPNTGVHFTVIGGLHHRYPQYMAGVGVQDMKQREGEPRVYIAFTFLLIE